MESVKNRVKKKADSEQVLRPNGHTRGGDTCNKSVSSIIVGNQKVWKNYTEVTDKYAPTILKAENPWPNKIETGWIKKKAKKKHKS